MRWRVFFSDPVERSKQRRKRRAVLEMLHTKAKTKIKTSAPLLHAKKRGRPPKAHKRLVRSRVYRDTASPGPSGVQAEDHDHAHPDGSHMHVPPQLSRESSSDEMYFTPRTSLSSPGPSGTSAEDHTSNPAQHDPDVPPQPRSHSQSVDEAHSAPRPAQQLPHSTITRRSRPSSSSPPQDAVTPLGSSPVLPHEDEIVEVKPRLASPASSSSRRTAPSTVLPITSAPQAMQAPSPSDAEPRRAAAPQDSVTTLPYDGDEVVEVKPPMLSPASSSSRRTAPSTSLPRASTLPDMQLPLSSEPQRAATSLGSDAIELLEDEIIEVKPPLASSPSSSNSGQAVQPRISTMAALGNEYNEIAVRS